MTILKKQAAIMHIVPDEACVEVLVEGLASAEGPVWMEEEGCLVFSEVGIAPSVDVTHNMSDTTNVAWGGPDWKTLYITTSSSLLCVQLKISGVPVCARAGY